MSGGRFERCLRFTLRMEGGYSNDPQDKGGETFKGITQKTLDHARANGWTRVKSVRDLSEADVEALFWNGFWMSSAAYLFPPPLDLLVFDAAVNHGPERGVKLGQLAIGAEPDGIPGSETQTKAGSVDKVTAIERYAYEREQLYRRIVKRDESQAKFLKGWLNRVAHVKSSALAEVA